MDNKQNAPALTPVTNTFTKGIATDSHEVNLKDNLVYARNFINRDRKQKTFGSNEHSNRLIHTFESSIIGKVYQEEEDRTFFLLEDQSIHFLNNNTEEVTKVCDSSEFYCNWEVDDCEIVDAKVYKKSCDTYLQWSAKWVYYIVNISEMLDTERKQKVIDKLTNDCGYCLTNCNYFKIFKPKCNPIVGAIPFQKGGGLLGGTYFYSARLLNVDGAVTNFSIPSKATYIYSPHNKPGEESNGRISAIFSNLDCSYEKIEIAITYFNSVGSSITRVLPARYFSGTSYTFNHIDTSQGDPIDITEILMKSSINLEGRFQTVYNEHMYYYGIRPKFDYNMQKITNQIKTKLYVEKYPFEVAERYQIKTLPRGETIAVGMWINHEDGSQSLAGHIPCSSDVVPTPFNFTNTSGAVGDDDINVDAGGGITQVTGEKYTRSRDPADKVDSVSNPLGADELLVIEEALVQSYTTDIHDLEEYIRPAATDNTDAGCTDCPDEMNEFINVKEGNKNADIIAKDLETVEQIAVKWSSILSDLIGEAGSKDLVKAFTPTTIKQVAEDIINSVKNREVIVLAEAKYTILKDINYTDGVLPNSQPPSTDPSNPSSEEPSENEFMYAPPQSPYESAGTQTTYPGGEFVGLYDTEPCQAEKDTVYPCIKDCDNELVFGDLTNTKVAHHKIPSEHIIPYYESKAVGVPSKLTPDADEYKDGYGYYIGFKFSNIKIDFDDYELKTGRKICRKNPFTIGQVKLTDLNKTVISKGMVFSNFSSFNQGKEYIYQTLGANSFERCSKYIDINGSRMHPTAPFDESLAFYSLDQSAIKPFVGHATTFEPHRELYGTGYRHFMYAEGTAPTNKTYGKRIDTKGTVQSINLSKQITVYPAKHTLSFATYVDANSVTSPPAQGSTPFMNKYGQEFLWLGGPNLPKTDKSFVGDVLNHSAPITDASAYYGVLRRELDNQYGDVMGLSYHPILNADNNVSQIKGLCGDRFISPYSFVKTSFVSDKVGDKFDMSLWNVSKSDRCICDDPNDSVNELVGKFNWTDLPKSGDKIDAKNWCGLHTPEGFKTKEWIVANNITITESDMYYPGTLKTLITYVGEWETNPYGVEISDELKKQRYPFIKPEFDLGSNITHKSYWDKGYLDQFHVKIEQPSAGQRILKVLIKSLINLVLPLLKLEDIMSPESGLELTGDISSLVLMFAVWMLGTKVLFTDDFIDDLLKLPKCKTQTEGGIDFPIEEFFTNFNQYSQVYNMGLEFVSTYAQQELTHCCNTNLDSYDNDIGISDMLIEKSNHNGYTHVRPNNLISITRDKGKIIELFTGPNGAFMCQTTDAIFSLITPQVELQTNSFALIGGQSTLKANFIAGMNPEGYAGIRTRFHALNCSGGRFMLDYEAGIFYHFNSDGLQPISFNNMDTFFREYTKYMFDGDEDTACIDNQRDYHISLGFDPVLQKVLITKFNKEDDRSWTLSYDYIEKKFVAFHDYFPNDYLNTRDKLYHLRTNEIWIHDEKTKTFGNFFGKQFQTIIDIPSVLETSKIYNNHILKTEAVRYSTTTEDVYRNENATFDQLGFWNSRQTAGMVSLELVMIKESHNYSKTTDRNNTILVKRGHHGWNINELHDYTNANGALITKLKSKYNIDYDVVNGNNTSDRAQQNSKARILQDNYFISRLIFENTLPNVKLYMQYVTVIFRNV